MQDTKRRKLNPYQSKFQVSDIVRNIDGGSEYIVVKKDRKNNPTLTLIRRYRPTHVYGDKLEVYPTNEFGIFLKDAPNYPKDGVHDGFNDISPPQEMTLMGSTSPDYLD